MALRKRMVLADEIHRFFDLFDPTMALVERLIAKKENAQEVLLLLCARLDALASCMFNEDKSNKESFTKLVVAYGRKRDLMESISAGDLYYESGFHRWLIDGTLPKPGRIVRFSRIDDPVIEMLDLSDIPLTAEAAGALLTRLMKVVESRCRCRPRQSLKKPSMLKPNALTDAIESEFRNSRAVEVDKLLKAIQTLLQSKSVAGLLYQDFRNAAVHGVKVEFDEDQFFSEPGPFWQSLYSVYYPSSISLKFSGSFLLTLLRDCLGTLRQAWLAKGKIPPDVHWYLFGNRLDEIHLLDTDLLPQVRSLRIQRSRS